MIGEWGRFLVHAEKCVAFLPVLIGHPFILEGWDGGGLYSNDAIIRL